MAKFVRIPPPAMKGTILVAGGEVDEYHLSLRFFGDDLNPDVVTSKLGGAPTSSCRKGDLFRGKTGERIERSGKWILALPEKPGETFEPQVLALLNSLTSDYSVWRELCAQFTADLICGLWLRHWNRGMELSPQIMAQLANRGLRLGFDIYVDLEEDNAKQA
jgi:hypothetical protein